MKWAGIAGSAVCSGSGAGVGVGAVVGVVHAPRTSITARNGTNTVPILLTTYLLIAEFYQIQSKRAPATAIKSAVPVPLSSHRSPEITLHHVVHIRTFNVRMRTMLMLLSWFVNAPYM